MKPHLYTNVPDYYAIIDDHAHHEHLIKRGKICMLMHTSTCTPLLQISGENTAVCVAVKFCNSLPVAT